MAIGLGMFLVSAAALSDPCRLFLSQRILLVHMVLSTFVAVSMVAGRLFNIRYAIVLLALLFGIWSLREAVTVGALGGGPLRDPHRRGEAALLRSSTTFYNAP